MEELYSLLKGEFPKATIHQLDEETIEVDFPKAKESVIIQAQGEKRYTVSYPKLVEQRNGKVKKEESETMQNILPAGIQWILKQVQKNGQVMPEF